MKRSVFNKAMSILLVAGLVLMGPLHTFASQAEESAPQAEDSIIDIVEADSSAPLEDNATVADSPITETPAPKDDVVVDPPSSEEPTTPPSPTEDASAPMEEDNSEDYIILGQSEEVDLIDTDSAMPLGASFAIAPFAAVPQDVLTFTDVTLTLNNGTPISATTPIPANSIVRINYDWTIDNGVVITAGDTYEFDIPVSFKGTGFSNGVLTDPDGGAIGTLAMDDNGHVTATFTSQSFLNKNDRAGFFYITLQFSSIVTEGPGRQPIDLGFNQEIEVLFDNPAMTNVMEKNGTLLDTDLIEWEIDFNQGYLPLDSGSVFIDAIPEGLRILTISDIEVHALDVNLNGTKTEGGIIGTTQIAYNPTTRVLTVTFDQPIDHPVRIRVNTQIDSVVAGATYINEATFAGTETASGSAVNQSASSTVVNDSEIIDDVYKEGKLNDVDLSIAWTVKYNYNKLPMDSAFTDRLTQPEDLNNTGVMWIYDITSFVVEKMEPGNNPDGSDQVIEILDPADYTITFNADHTSFDIDLNPASTTDINAYRIAYKTIVNDPLLAKQKGVLINEILLGSDIVGTGSVGVHPWRPTAGLKKTSVINTSKNAVEWIVTFNHGSYGLALENAVIKDTIPPGIGILSIIQQDPQHPITITDSNGNDVSTSDFDFDIDSNDLGFRLTFKNGYKVEGKHSIKFYTTYNFDGLGESWDHYYRNNVTLDYSNKYNDAQLSVNYKAKVDKELILNHARKEGTYSPQTNTFDWEVIINYNSLNLADVKLTDVLSPDQVLLPGSIKVYNVTNGTGNKPVYGSLVPDSVYNITASNDEGFTLNFLAPITSSYAIIYSSKPVGIIRSDGLYSNIATLNNIGPIGEYERKLDASISIANPEVFATKSGKVVGRTMEWSIVANPNQSTIEDAFVTDTLSPNQRYDRDSFKVYEASYNANGTLIQGALVDPTNYGLTLSAPTATTGESFTLKFQGALSTIDSPYFIKYVQKIFAPAGQNTVTIVNSVIVGGGSVPSNITIATEDVVVSGGGGGGWGGDPDYVTIGGIVWHDLDQDGLRNGTENSEIFKNIVLKLVDQDGNPVKDIYGVNVTTTTTGDDGRYLFDNLPILTSGKSYVVVLDGDASSTVLNGYAPTLEHVGSDKTIDSATGSETTTDPALAVGGGADLTLDFGFILIPKVSIGGIVWHDVNKDGLRNGGENAKGFADVTLKITDKNGNPVTDVNGRLVLPTKTNATGHYTFDNLPVLNDGESYIVVLDNIASQTVLANYVPTLDHVGNDKTIDSATGSETTIDPALKLGGGKDLTLDFGFIRTSKPIPPTSPPSSWSSDPTKGTSTPDRSPELPGDPRNPKNSSAVIPTTELPAEGIRPASSPSGDLAGASFNPSTGGVGRPRPNFVAPSLASILIGLVILVLTDRKKRMK